MGTSNSKDKESKPNWLKRAVAGKANKESATSTGESSAHAPAAEAAQDTLPATESPEDLELTRKYGRSFASEVALLQMMDGGSTEYNIERVLKKRAKRDKKSRSAGAVSDSGGLFVDQEEREEHLRLLPRRREDSGKK